MTETILLSLGSSAVALIFARVGLDVLRSSIPADMARYMEGWNNVRVDSRLALIMPAFAIIVGLAVGLLPALSVSQASVMAALNEGDRSTGGSPPTSAAPRRDGSPADAR